MKNQVKLEKKVMEFADTLNGKGYDLKDVMFALFHRAMIIFSTEEGVEQVIVDRTDKGVSLSWPEENFEARIVPEDDMRSEVLEVAGQQFAFYMRQHFEKGTQESLIKSDVNARMAALCFDAIGAERAVRPVALNPQAPIDIHLPALTSRDTVSIALSPEWSISGDFPVQESDSGLPAPLEAGTPRTLSTAPLDRAEVLAWIDMKIEGANKNGMEEARGVLMALRGEIAQHLEAAPIDFETALRAFYADVYGRNLKAGWWTDLATGQPKKRSVGELFMLFVTEIAEAYSAYLTNAADDKLPQYPGLGVELADVQIRLADFCGALLAGNIVEFSGVDNPGDAMFTEIVEIASRYEAIRKTPAAIGQAEIGGMLPVGDVAEMTIAKLAFNAVRADHQIENRLKDDGKRT